MYGALVFWVLITVFVIWQPYLLEVPPVRMVVTLLLALPIAIFWFIFWPQKLVANCTESIHASSNPLGWPRRPLLAVLVDNRVALADLCCPVREGV